MLDRLELVCAQTAELEQKRNAVLGEEAPDKAEKTIQQLAGLRGIGVQSATRARKGSVRPRIRQWQDTRLLRRAHADAVQ